MQRKLTITLLFIVICVLFAFFTPGRAAAETAEDISIEAEGGFGGIARLGAWTPLSLRVSSPKRSVAGEIQVEASLDQARKIIIANPAVLTEGAAQEFHFEIPVVSAYKGIVIRLVENKKTLAEEKFAFTRLLPPEIALIGVLSEDPDAFAWMNGNTVPTLQGAVYDEKTKLMIASGQISPSASVAVPMTDSDGTFTIKEAVVVPLNRDTFPEKTEVIDGFDFLMISRFDTGLLSEGQLDAMEKWVDSGGTLMLGTGVSWQKVYHGLPDSLKPYKITGVKDVRIEDIIEKFTGRYAPEMQMKLAQGELGFEYVPVSAAEAKPGLPTRYFNNDIIAGDAQNPLVVKYGKEAGNILVFGFDPSADPFASWQSRTTFMEYTLRFLNSSLQRFYEYGKGYYQKQSYSADNLQYLATEMPGDKMPPFLLMFVCLGIYIVVAGPVLYIILKKTDRRDWAWVIIPALSVLFLVGMYLFGFKTRYNSAVTNTVSIIDILPDEKEAVITSSIGVFNDRRGTLKLEYSKNNGVQTPFLQSDDYRYYGGNDIEGKVVGKYTMGEPAVFENYDVMLWTPMTLSAKKIIPFEGDLLKDLYLKDGRLQGSIANISPYDLLDAVIVLGTNIIPVGDIITGDSKIIDIPLDSPAVYRRPDEYLDGEFGRSYYSRPSEYPPDYREMMQKRRIFENYINTLYNNQQGKARFTLLARNDQIIDYGLTVNGKKPQLYNQNLVRMESEFSFKTGQEVEIPGGIIRPAMYQTTEVGWQDGNNSIRINNTGDLEFRFTLPEKLDVSEMRLSVDTYIPLYVKYNIAENQRSNTQTEILSNKYEYYLYNYKTGNWDEIDAKALINENASRYIGSGNDVRMKISVVEVGNRNREDQDQGGVYKNYEQELLSMPDISLKGAAR